MEWHDDGLIIHTHSLGESRTVVHLLTQHHGRHGGVLRLSKKTRGHFQLGQHVKARHRARLETQLGQWSLEPVGQGMAALFNESGPLLALQSACSLLQLALPERHEYPHLYQQFLHLLESLHSPLWLESYILFEVLLLQELGYGLDFSCCAVTGSLEGLTAISPRTGRAVSRDAAAPFLDKLLPLPGFLLKKYEASAQEKLDGLRLTGYFFHTYAFVALGLKMPPVRERLLLSVCKMEQMA